MESDLRNLDTAELEKAKMVIGQFITSCSHTMRGPLKSILGLKQLLENYRNYSEEEMVVFLNLVASLVEKMERTLDELEHFLENAKRDVLIKSIDCREMLSLVLHQFRDEISTGRIDLVSEVDQPVVLYSDAGRFRLILVNLLSNAIQFKDVAKEQQKIGVVIRVTSEECVMSVTDNGIGIAKDQFAKIFGLFYRASLQSSGTGIGLYVVKEALDKMHGEIEVKSSLKDGSVFTIKVPNMSGGRLQST